MRAIHGAKKDQLRSPSRKEGTHRLEKQFKAGQD